MRIKSHECTGKIKKGKTEKEGFERMVPRKGLEPSRGFPH
jgi:hypothetical protein